MIIKPLIRDKICLSSHPLGCATAVRNQIAYVREQFSAGLGAETENLPKLALVIGCSNGYGLASRITAAFGYGAATAGVSYEKSGSAAKPGTPGWYHNRTFDAEAAAAGIPSVSLEGDAFSDKVKEDAAEAVKKLARTVGLPPRIDLIIYSLASPARTDPDTGVMYRSAIKPVGRPFSGKTIDMFSGKISDIRIEAAGEDEIAQTTKVMGGEDWERWIGFLDGQGLLSPKVRTIAYTYIGPELSWPIYKQGTIGRAKEDLERAARVIGKKLALSGGAAWVSVNKALVTRSSAVIPIIPLYISCLFKVMKEKGLHEGCIEQIVRLCRERLYHGESAADNAKVPVDGEGRIRLDDLEMREDVQKETAERIDSITEENIAMIADLAGYRHDFLEAHGFDMPGIDYEADVDPQRI